MGVPFNSTTFCSLLAVQDFVDSNPDLRAARIKITGVHVQDVFELVDLLTGKGWVVKNLGRISGGGRRFAMFVEDYQSLVDEAIECIDDEGAITANTGESLKDEAVKFLELVKGNKNFNFFIGFAQFTVHLGDDAIEAATLPDGAPADGESRLIRLRDKFVQVKAALNRLLELRLVFPASEENPVQYDELADFAQSFPVDPEPEPIVPPALPADIDAQPNAVGADAAQEE